MTIELPRHIEDSIIAKVHCGLFPSMDAAMTEAARLLLERIEQEQHAPKIPGESGQGFIGALRDDADLLDQAVEHAMKVREERKRRARQALEAKLLEGLQSPTTVMNGEDWDSIEREAQKRFNREQAGADDDAVH